MKTSKLEQEIASSETFDERLILDNQNPAIVELIEKQLELKGISRSELIRALNIDRCYGYQLLNGTRTPTRDFIIQIGLYFGVSFDDMQSFLKSAGRKPLYVKELFDAKVFFALKHKMPYDDAVLFVWGNSRDH